MNFFPPDNCKRVEGRVQRQYLFVIRNEHTVTNANVRAQIQAVNRLILVTKGMARRLLSRNSVILKMEFIARMKMIVAIIQPYKLDVVRNALQGMGCMGVTVSDVQGYGRQKGHAEVYRGHEYSVSFVRKVKLEIACEDSKVDEILRVIGESARNLRVCDDARSLEHRRPRAGA